MPYVPSNLLLAIPVPTPTSSPASVNHLQLAISTLPPDSASTYSSIVLPTTAENNSTRSNPTMVADEVGVLAAISEDITALSQVSDIREAILQVQNGTVQAYYDRYGPKVVDGKRQKADPIWATVRNLVSRRKRLHHQLTGPFKGDEDRFFAFFTVPPLELEQRGKHSKGEVLRPMHILVEAITPMEKDIGREHLKAQYCGSDGKFSPALWESF